MLKFYWEEGLLLERGELILQRDTGGRWRLELVERLMMR